MTAQRQHRADTCGLTARLGAAVAGLGRTDVPDAAFATARRGLADCVGVMIAGSVEPAVARVRAALGTGGPGAASGVGSGGGRLIPGGTRCGARFAALLNGIAGHVLDYDDVALDGHPSAVLVPAVLAEAEAVGATGRDVLRGYVAGYETWAALWRASPDPLHGRGWHPSGVFGTVAAAAACSAVRGLSEQETVAALGLAAAQAGGLVANFGTMAKSFQVGRAAEAGLVSARLAAAGVDASPQALEHRSGFLRAYAGDDRPAEGGFGRPNWSILSEGLDTKVYPVCYATHRLIDGALGLFRDERPAAGEIAGIELRLGRIQSEILNSRRPSTVLEAKFSCEFATAAALVDGAVGLRQLSDGFVRRDDVQSLVARTDRIVDDEIGEAPFSPFDQVTLRLTGGRTLVGRPVRHASGSRHAPLGRDEAWAKFEDAAGPHLPAGGAERLFDSLWNLDPERRIADLLDDAGLRAEG